MSNKKVLIISILSMFTVIMLIIGLILFSINRKEMTLTQNVEIIKSNYAKFSTNTIDSEKIKSDLLTKLETFSNETYEQERADYVKILRQYDENVKYISEIVKDLETRCDYKYEDTVVTLLCKGFDILYEETINTYITNVNNYNEKIEKYNETAEKKHTLHKLAYTEYIDYDKDGEYEGK